MRNTHYDVLYENEGAQNLSDSAQKTFSLALFQKFSKTECRFSVPHIVWQLTPHKLKVVQKLRAYCVSFFVTLCHLMQQLSPA